MNQITTQAVKVADLLPNGIASKYMLLDGCVNVDPVVEKRAELVVSERILDFVGQIFLKRNLKRAIQNYQQNPVLLLEPMLFADDSEGKQPLV